MSTTQPTEPADRYDLDRLIRDLADYCCAAEEAGNEELAAALNRAIDAIETWVAGEGGATGRRFID